ncbi:DNA-binding transcriptional LysR family regulator [Sphingomonas zeae]|nr:DNA-binding transcriptional LysR family regulator [Sphingomonas zeae]
MAIVSAASRSSVRTWSCRAGTGGRPAREYDADASAARRSPAPLLLARPAAQHRGHDAQLSRNLGLRLVLVKSANMADVRRPDAWGGLLDEAGERTSQIEGRSRLRRLNINLLYSLDALLHSPSLTAAARSIAISQPAMSVKLRQLREHFGDELVLFTERRQLTALGEALRQRVGRLLREVDDTFNLTLDFDPATARQTITLTAPEVVELMFFSRIVPRLRAVAPGVELKMVPFAHGSARRLFDAGVDVAIVPEAMADRDLCTAALLDHQAAALVCAAHPFAGRRVDAAEYCAAPHAAVHEDMERAILGDFDAESPLARRRVVVRTGLHSMLPTLVIGSDLIATTSNWFAQHQAACLPVVILDLAFRQQSTRIVAQWQPYRDKEPVIRWLVAELKRGADGIGKPIDLGL